jgi:hypothetical protein
MNLILNFVIAVTVHLGLWKPTGAAAKVQEDVGLKVRDWEEPVTR